MTDSLLHIYHYVPVGRVYYKSLVLLFINCGYMPLPEKYGDSDISDLSDTCDKCGSTTCICKESVVKVNGEKYRVQVSVTKL